MVMGPLGPRSEGEDVGHCVHVDKRLSHWRKFRFVPGLQREDRKQIFTLLRRSFPGVGGV